jgi:RHS repeat-associated protein
VEWRVERLRELVQCISDGGTVHANYAYDPLGRRIEKSGAGVTTTYYLSDGADEIAEYDQNKALTVRYVPGPAIDEPVAVVTGNAAPYTHRYFHTDRQGSVIAMSDDSGAKVEGPYVYDPYGNCFSGGSARSSSGEPYRFTGRRLDPETGLLYYRARYYWPQGGRFLSTDPVGYAADLNLYTYVGNDPTNRTDPTGQCPWCLGAAIGGGLELGLQLMTPQGRAAYAAAASAIARGDYAGAVKAAGANVAKVALSAAAGAAGVGIASKVAEVANIASKAAEVGGVGKVLVNAGVNAAGNAAAGAGLGAATQAGGNIASGQPVSSGTGAAALYGGAGGAVAPIITGAVSGETQNLATATGEMVAGHAGVAAPGVTSSAAERAGAIGGPVVEKALSTCGGPSAQSGSPTCH